MAETVREHPAGKQSRALSHYSLRIFTKRVKARYVPLPAPNEIESMGGMRARRETTNAAQIVEMSARIGATVERAWTT